MPDAPAPETVLLSFDIDGTMAFGDPPGHLSPQLVRLARDQGYIVGSASDRTLAEQRRLWAEHAVEVDFVSGKHTLEEVRERFGATHCLHVGDTDVDRYFATRAGFVFCLVTEVEENGDGLYFLTSLLVSQAVPTK